MVCTANTANTTARFRKVFALLAGLALVFGCATCSGCTITMAPVAQQQVVGQAASQMSADASISERLLAIDGVTSVEEYTNDYIAKAGLDQKYKIYEVTFQEPVDHSDASAGSFDLHVRLFYAGDGAVNIVDTEGYMLLDLPASAYQELCSQTFASRYGTPNMIQMEYRFFGNSTPAGLNNDSTELWNYLTMEQAASDFHDVVQKMSSVLSGKRIWTGTSKGGLTTGYQCYFQEQHGYNDADAFVAFCAPFCDGSSDSRMMDALYGEIGYKSYGEEQASEWHDLLDRFQLACIKHRDELQTRYYQQAVEEGCKFRESYFGTDANTQAERLWDVAVNEFPAAGFWQYYQEKVVDRIAQAINDDDPEQIYACIAEFEPPSSYASNVGFFPYAVQSYCEMGNYEENFDYLRQLVAEARDAAPDDEKAAYYVAVEDNRPYSEMYLTSEQLDAMPYDASTRNAMIEWLNSTDTAHLIMVSGQSDPWYFVRPDLSFSNSRIKCFESSYNHTTTIANLSKSEQSDVWHMLDAWLGFVGL